MDVSSESDSSESESESECSSESDSDNFTNGKLLNLQFLMLITVPNSRNYKIIEN